MRKIAIVISLFVIGQISAQQDVHYSMWYGSPSLLNPAATATMEQDYTLFTNYRTQWMTALDQPFRTNSFSGEMKMGAEKMNSGWFGAGIHFTNDATGENRITTNYVSVPINYVFEMTSNRLFSIGFKPGVINRTKNSDIQTWDNQWNGIAFDNSVISGESSGSRLTVFDIGAGMYFKKEWDNRSKFDFGIAANHLNAPGVNFQSITNQLYRQYIVHTSMSLKPRKYRFMVSPQIITMFQGPQQDIIIGSSIDFLLKEGSTRTTFRQQQTFGIGLNYRMYDALIVSFMLKMNGFQIGASYDAALFGNRKATKTVGAAEVFLKYSFFKNQKRRFIH
jgi:type IX secretion system PorP/SprF family membrane protein|tara:strand:+ start:35141 stop:36145 length:1005 start_codon:yes stop_codon:yes gene_type:complete